MPRVGEVLRGLYRSNGLIEGDEVQFVEGSLPSYYPVGERRGIIRGSDQTGCNGCDAVYQVVYLAPREGEEEPRVYSGRYDSHPEIQEGDQVEFLGGNRHYRTGEVRTLVLGSLPNTLRDTNCNNGWFATYKHYPKGTRKVGSGRKFNSGLGKFLYEKGLMND